MNVFLISAATNSYVKVALLFAFLCINSVFFGQETIQFSENLDWSSDLSNELTAFSFKNKTEFATQNTVYDTYKKRIKLVGSYADSEAYISNIVAENIEEDLLTFDQKASLNNEFEVFSKIIQIRNEYSVEITIIPFKKTSNNIQKLISFDVNIDNTPQYGNPYNPSNNKTAVNSVLAEGTWYKIAIAQDGVYRLNKDHLTELGIDINDIDPQKINIYGNGGELLPLDNATIVSNELRYDDLQKNSIIVSGEDDGNFNQGDYILFYGKGPNRWRHNNEKFEHTKHYYSDSAYYYLRIDDDLPKRIENFSESTNPVTHSVSSFQDYKYIEANSVNFIHSGRNFVGDEFAETTSKNYSLTFPNITGDPILVEYNFASRSIGGGSSFEISHGGDSDNLVINATGTSSTSNYANLKYGSFSTTSTSDAVSINVSYNKFNPASTGWLDYLRINASRELTMIGTQMHFRNINSIGLGNVTQFQIANTNSLRSIWNITDLANVTSIDTDLLTGDNSSFTVNTDQLNQFIAFTNSNFLSPRMVGSVNNQNIHALASSPLDLIIVSSPLLKSQADELAELHREDGLVVEVITPMTIFNEFSSGNPDVTAIKLFMKHLYDNAADSDSRIKNLLIFGDASFSGNKSVNAINSFNVICYESENSVSPTNSYVTDDYFVLLEDTAEDNPSDDLMIGVGRIPASSQDEAEKFVDKIRIYMGKNTTVDGGAACIGDDSDSAYGAWRNLVVFVTDDRDGNGENDEKVHMETADNHTDDIWENHNDFNVVKLYMDAYQQVSTPGGERYPGGESAIRNRVEDGALLVAYIGHGGERGWAHERILNTSTIQNWTNKNRLPVFFTATCELSRFDYAAEKSAGELLLLNPNGGAIAMLTTTRIVFTAQNASLGSSFYEIVLDHENQPGLTLGDIMKHTKNNSQNINTKNFSLLGDPALKMAYPKQQVFTTEINGFDLSQLAIDELAPDTVKALQEVTMKGYVGNQNGDILSDFNGFVYPSVYDKKSQVTALNNDNHEVDYSYEVFKSIIYRGKASVTNGEFEFTFIVPKDINFTPGSARVSYYAVDNSKDANGHFEKFIVGDISDDVVLNTTGPEIELFLNDTTFVFGGITNETPILVARISDENGINTTGNGIGHDIKSIIDNEQANSIILNENYESDLDTYKSGEVRYQLDELTEGTHTISLKVWDVQNNSSEAFTEFVVAQNSAVALDHVLNYPNPFTTHTDFYFEHNQACEFLEVQVQVFTISGKLVKTINQLIESPGFRSEPISWDGKDDFGDKIGRGVYVYRVKVKTPEGKSAEKFEKLVILK